MSDSFRVSGGERAGSERAAGDAEGVSALLGNDWRGPAATPVSPAPARQKAAPAQDPLHRKARKGTPAEEAARARELVAVAKIAVVETFDDLRFGRSLDVSRLEPIIDGISASIFRCATALPGVVRLKERHEYTYLHSIAVCGLMIGLARELEVDRALMPDIGLAGLLHDIGKSRVPAVLLDKAGPLSSEEFGVVRQHVERGRDILLQAGNIPPIPIDVCLHHHERMDGRGYPSGLTGDQLSIYARMGAICDVYDAVTSARSYKRTWTPGEALEWMNSTNGHFDPRLLSAFTTMVGIFPLGSLVRLRSQRLAVVLEQRDEVDSVPLGIFFCAESNRPMPWKLGNAALDPIVGMERADRWAIENWQELREQILAHFSEQLA